MKVVILAGGLGTRISEYTKTIPKPMIKINKKPIICHIMNHYSKFGFNEFYIAAGYKGKVIKDYFKNNYYKNKIRIFDTGKKTMTGGRLRRLKRYLKDETFLMTYGDGVSNVNIKKLVEYHKKKRKLVTLTAVRPPARFGAIKIKNGKVLYFKEKSKLDESWINGGFFVMEPEFLKYLKNDNTYLERDPFEKACKQKQLNAFKHNGFWQCMDTKRDKDYLEKIFKKRKL
jgi:glucose-1-phosphate cytidylyltransferase